MAYHATADYRLLGANEDGTYSVLLSTRNKGEAEAKLKEAAINHIGRGVFLVKVLGYAALHETIYDYDDEGK